MNVANLISGSSASLKFSLYIWKFSIQVLLKASLKDFDHYLANMWNEQNCMVVWTFFGTNILWDWNETWPFPGLWRLLSFPNLLRDWVKHFNSTILNSSAGMPSPPLALFVVMLSKAHLSSHSRMSGSRWVITPCDYLGREDLFCIVLLNILATSS